MIQEKDLDRVGVTTPPCQVPGEGRTCSLGSDKTMSPVSIYSNTYI